MRHPSWWATACAKTGSRYLWPWPIESCCSTMLFHGVLKAGQSQALVYPFWWQGIEKKTLSSRRDNHIFPLCRLVSSNKSNGEGEYCTFCIRTGTSKGVVNRVFRAECERDLTSWARGLVTGTHNCVTAVREAAWGIEFSIWLSE